MKTELRISGMTCASCAGNVQRALEVAGARDVHVDWRTAGATVETNGLSPRALAQALNGTRYAVERVVDPGAGACVSAEAYDYDLAIVGSGGGAFAAAIAARRRDLRVVMVERSTIGGTCVNVGCIPSKALLAAAEACYRASQPRFPGITTQAGPVDFAALMAGKREIVETMRPGEVRRSRRRVRLRDRRRQRALR